MPFTYSHYQDDEEENVLRDSNNINNDHNIDDQLSKNVGLVTGEAQNFKEEDGENDEEEEDEEEYEDDIIDNRNQLNETPMTMSYTNSLLDINFNPTMTTVTTKTTNPSQLMVQKPKI
ncbi:hypothetical protein C6P44_003486 [Monosporozyma unispora]|nr:hypothetical protein C6P44_003486 [Kazachstania unispora]